MDEPAVTREIDPESRFVTRGTRRRYAMLILATADALSIVIAVLLATLIRFGTLTAPAAIEGVSREVNFISVGLWLVPLWMVFLYSEHLYDLDSLSLSSGLLSRVARALSIGVVAFIVLTYVLKLAGLSRAWTLLVWVLASLFVVFGRVVIRGGLSALFRRGRLLRRTLIVGSNAEAARIIRVLQSTRTDGLVPIGCLASSQVERLSLDFCADDVPCLGFGREIAQVVASAQVDTVIIASTAFDHDVLARMVAELRGVDVELNISSGLFDVLTSRVLVHEIAGVPLVAVRGISLSRTRLLTKRMFDLAVGTCVVLVGIPVWVAVALAIKSESKGPIFYVQERVGRRGQPFGMYKFRSMVSDADERLAELMSQNEAKGAMFKMKDDPRVTRVGRWMRKFSIDEFPQLLNVLRGEMSLVGPRPPLPREVKEYTPNDWRRLDVVPGMTGLWQVSGRSKLTFEEMVRLDLFYIENWSVGLDISLLARTVPAVLGTGGAY